MSEWAHEFGEWSMRVGEFRLTVSGADDDGEWHWRVIGPSPWEPNIMRGGFAASLEAAQRAAADGLRAICNETLSALPIPKRYSVALCGTCGVRLGAGVGIQCGNCGEILRVRWSEA